MITFIYQMRIYVQCIFQHDTHEYLFTLEMFQSCCFFIFKIILIACYIALFSGLAFEPEFVEPIKNVTTAIGRQATLSCAVNHLGSNKASYISLFFSFIWSCVYNILFFQHFSEKIILQRISIYYAYISLHAHCYKKHDFL